MRSGIAKFKQLRHFATALCLSTALSGCALMPAYGSGESPVPQRPLQPAKAVPAIPGHGLAALLMRAEAARHRNDLKTAQVDYAKASLLTDNPEVAERAVGLALALHDSNAARKAMLRRQALGADRVDLLRVQAQIALDEGNTGDARNRLVQLTAQGGKRAWQTFGKVLLNARDAAQAGQLLEQVASPKRLPDDVLAWLAMSELGQKLGRFGYAVRIADLAAARFHTHEAYAWAAGLHVQRGEDKTARALYAKAVATSPEDINTRFAYAGLLAQAGDFRTGGRVLAKGPQNGRTYAARASFAARTKDMKSLRRVYDELRTAPLKLREDNYYLLGQLASLVDKPQTAIDWLAKVPLNGKRGLDAGIRRAVLLQEIGKPDQAHALISSLQKANSASPPVVRRLTQVGAELYMQAGDYKRASAAYTHALGTDSEVTNLLYGRGLAFAEAGDVDAAITDFREVLRQNPDDIDAVNALGFTLADANRDLDLAGKLLDRAHTAKPNDPAITDSWGWLQYRLGHLEHAEQALRLSWNKRKDPEVGAHLAQVLLAEGKKAEAERVYRAALRLDPHNGRLLALKGKFKL